MMSFGEAVKTCLSKFFTFKGRARRSEFWWFILFTLCVSWAFSFAGMVVPFLSYIGTVITLVLDIPIMAALTRRLHDTRHSGWWVVILATLYIAVLGMMCYLIAPYIGQLVESSSQAELAEILVNSIQANGSISGAMIGCSWALMIVSIITLVFTVRDSQRDTNRYGSSPKYQ